MTDNIVYITDIEGDLSYFEKFISLSEGFDKNGNLKPNYQFVFGGDALDHNEGI